MLDRIILQDDTRSLQYQVIESRSPEHFEGNVTTRNVLATDYLMTTSFTFDERGINQVLFCSCETELHVQFED